MTQRRDAEWQQEQRPVSSEAPGVPRPEDAGPPDPGRRRGRGEEARDDGDALSTTDGAQRPDDPGAHAAAPDRSEAAELEDRWRRALANLDNLRKRYDRELLRERAAERERVAAAFLPVLDNIDLALQHADAAPGAIVEGVRAIREQALAVLARLGYPRQEEAGVPFDATRHEVVAVVPTEEGSEPGTVVQVVRPGYGDADQSLRPAAVTVAHDAEN